MMGNSNIPKNVRELHDQLVIADGHCDTLLELVKTGRRLANPSITGHVDLERLKKVMLESSSLPHLLNRSINLITQ